MPTQIGRVYRGEVLHADYLNQLADQLNTLANNFAPRDVDGGIFDSDDENTDAGGGTWVELSRATDTLRVEDPDDSDTYVDVQRMTQVSFSTPAGIVSLLFTNP